MARNRAGPGSLGAAAASAGAVRPSVGNALPFFVSLAVFPLVWNAAIQGGWWIAAPLLFMMIPDFFDAMFGLEERNMDPRKTLERELFWYKLSLWLWAVLWPATLVFTLWQILVAGHLATWESVLMALVLSSVAQASFIIGHELIHRRIHSGLRILSALCLGTCLRSSRAGLHPGRSRVRSPGLQLMEVSAEENKKQPSGRMALRTGPACAAPSAGLALHQSVLAVRD